MNVYPQFQYYDSDAESEGSNNDQEFYGNGDVGVVSPGPGWSRTTAIKILDSVSILSVVKILFSFVSS